MAWSRFVLLLLLMSDFSQGSTIVFEASDTVFQPSLTKCLSILCSVNDSVQTISGAVVGKRDILQTNENIDHVTSILIKQNGIDVATVTPYIPAKSFSNAANMQVTGDVTATSAGQRGFLELNLTYPTNQDIGNYTCDISGVNSQGHQLLLKKTLMIQVSTPVLEDLVKLVHLHDLQMSYMKSQLQTVESQLQTVETENKDMKSQLQTVETENKDMKSQLHNLETKNQLLEEKYTSLETNYSTFKTEMTSSLEETRHVEQGVTYCGGSNNQQWITKKFSRPYLTSPVVHVSFSHMDYFIDVTGNSRREPYYFINLNSVTTEGFSVQCYFNEYPGLTKGTMLVMWTSIPA